MKMTLNPNAIEFIPSLSISKSLPSKKNKSKRKNKIKLDNKDNNFQKDNHNEQSNNKIRDKNILKFNHHYHNKEMTNNKSIWDDNDFPTLTIADEDTLKKNNNKELTNNIQTYSVVVSSNKYNDNDDNDISSNNNNDKLVITTWNRNSYNENDDDINNNDINNNDINNNDINNNDNNDDNTKSNVRITNPRMRFSGYAKKFEERWIIMAREIGEKQRMKNVTNNLKGNNNNDNDKRNDFKSWHQILSPVIKYNLYDDINSDSDNDNDNNDINTNTNTNIKNYTKNNENSLKYNKCDWIMAIKTNNNDMINTIVSTGFDWIDITIDEVESNITNDNNNKPNKISSLHYCAKYNYCLCLELLVSPSMSSSFDIDSRDRKFKMTALHRAALYGHKEATQILLNRGSDPAAKDKIGENCLHKAVRSNNHSCVLLLINTNKVKVNHKNRRRESPMLLVKSKDIAQSLLLNGSEIDNVNIDGDDILSITARRGDHRLLSTLINCNSLNRIQYQQLLTSNNDQNIPRTTALHEACKFSNENCLKMIIASELYDINSTANSDQATPLLLSSLHGNVNMVQLLLNASADPTIECALGYNSLVAALLSGHVLCANEIIRHHPSILQKLNEQKENCLDILIKHVNSDNNQTELDMQQYIPCIRSIILHPQGINLSKQFMNKICHNDNLKVVNDFFTRNIYDMASDSNKMPVYFNVDMRKWIKGKEDVTITVKNNRFLYSYVFVLNHVSSILATMLSDQYDHRDQDGRIILNFPSNEYAEFELLLLFINTRQDVTTNVNGETLISLLLLSSKLQIQQLQYMCESRIALCHKSYDKKVLAQLCEVLQLKRLPLLCKVIRNKNTMKNGNDDDIIELLLNDDEEKWAQFLMESVLGSTYDTTNVLLEKKKANMWLSINLSSSLVTTEVVKRQCLQKVEVASLNILKIYHTIEKDNDDNLNKFYHIILKSLFGSSVSDKIFKKILYEEPHVGWNNSITLSTIVNSNSLSISDLRDRIDEVTPSFLLLLNFREELFTSENDKDVYIFAINDEDNKDKPVKANSHILTQCGKIDAMLRFQRAQEDERSVTTTTTSSAPPTASSTDTITNLELLDITYDHLCVIIRFLYTGILLLSKDIDLTALIHNHDLNEDTVRIWLNYLIELLFIAEEYLILTMKDQIEMILLAILTNNSQYSKYLFLVANTLNMKLLSLSSSACYLVNVIKNVKTNNNNNVFLDNDDFTEDELIEMMLKTIMSKT